jgi:hypothetical protein
MKHAVAFVCLLALSFTLSAQTKLTLDQVGVPKQPLARVIVILPDGRLAIAQIGTNLVLDQTVSPPRLNAQAQSCNLPAMDLFVCPAGTACGPVFTTTKMVATCNGASFFQVHVNGQLMEVGFDYTSLIVAGKTEITFKALPTSGDVRVRIDYQTPAP